MGPIVMTSIVDIFTSFFGNIFNDIMLLIFLLIGIIIGMLFRPKWKNTVMKMMPKDRRFVDFDIKQETAVSVICEDKKGFPPHRFIKLAEGFMGQVGWLFKRSATRYLGKEGTAYCWQADQDRFKKIPGGLAATLKTLWGENEYNAMPEDLRLKLEENKILVTVDLAEGLTPEGMISISEEDIKREEDREAAHTLWEGKHKLERGTYLNMLIIGVAGFGIACLLMIIGILRIPTVATPTPPTNSAGA